MKQIDKTRFPDIRRTDVPPDKRRRGVRPPTQLDFYLEFPCVMYEFDFSICGICRDFPNFSSLFGVFRNWWVFHNHLVKRNLRISEVLLSSLFHHNTTSTEFIYLFVGNFLYGEIFK